MNGFTILDVYIDYFLLMRGHIDVHHRNFGDLQKIKDVHHVQFIDDKFNRK